jgi:hypothetical protein
MGLETEYVEYGIELILTILGLTLTYFIDTSNPITLLSLSLIPILYGYTAYISREEFNYASLTSLSALVFVVVGGITAVTAAFYGIGNILVSYFSSGNRFKDYYGATSLPILITGLIIGISVFGYSIYNPGVQDQLAETVGEQSGQISKSIIPSEMVENQQRSQIKLVNSTSLTAVRLTSQEVINQTGETQELRKAFKDAEKPVKKRIHDRFRQKLKEKDVDLESRVEKRFTEQIKQMNFILVIPILTGLFYGLQPLIGILTGLFASFFALVDPS